MTTLNEAKEAVYSRFTSDFTGVPLVNIAFDNEEFEEPVASDWVRLTVRSVDRSQDTLGGIGNRRFRSEALVLVQVYTQFNTGVKQSDALAKAAADVFDAVSFSGLDFQAATTRETGPDGKWYQSVAEAPFSFDEIK